MPDENKAQNKSDEDDEVRHPGPTDSGNEGGMATREVAPEVARDGQDGD